MGMHAFPGGRARSVSVRLHRSGKGRLRLAPAAGGTGGRHAVAATRGGLGDDRGGREEVPASARERSKSRRDPLVSMVGVGKMRCNSKPTLNSGG